MQPLNNAATSAGGFKPLVSAEENHSENGAPICYNPFNRSPKSQKLPAQGLIWAQNIHDPLLHVCIKGNKRYFRIGQL